MRVIILTTSLFGTAGHHLPTLASASGVEIVAVILSEGQAANRRRRYLKTAKKLLKIGLAGAINGVRMRRWYNDDLNRYSRIKNVEETCRKLNIPFERVPSANSKRTQQLFRDLNPDLGLSLGNGYISSKVFTIPKYGMLNIHHEILPDYQNAQSVIWQIYNGSCETGYTIHKIDRHIDTGDILLQERMPISFMPTLGETVTATLAVVFDRSAEGLKKVLEAFETYWQGAYPQTKGRKYTTPSYWQYLKIVRNFKKLKKKVNTVV